MRNIYCWLFAISFTTLKNETLVPLEGDIENGMASRGDASQHTAGLQLAEGLLIALLVVEQFR